MSSVEPAQTEDWDEEEDYDEDDEDEDIDAEAQEIARRLGEQLWADISNANAAAAASAPKALPTISSAAAAAATHSTISSGPIPIPNLSKKAEAVITTMKAILSFVANDPLAYSTLSSTAVPALQENNVLDMLQRCVNTNSISKNVAMPLSEVLVSLARSEALFGTLRHSNASAIQLDKGKRKREETDEGVYFSDLRAHKRQFIPDNDLHGQVVEAARVIAQALGAPGAQPLDPSLVSSIRLQLHQVFLFCVTSSAGRGPEMHALQEIGGLIQVIGVLSGIQIGRTTESIPPPFPSNPAYPWLPTQPPVVTDIGTAVYPCLVAGCRRIFSRLYSLRAHQRSHSAHRPYRCNACPASFARNHDLKRHVKLHDRKAWKCGGCQKVFSRRDAIKRHKNGIKNRGPKSDACLHADTLEVELDDEEGEDSLREERRAKLWNGIAITQANVRLMPPHVYRDDLTMEEGEIQPGIIAAIQVAVLNLHGLLQAHVGNALGAPMGHPPPMVTDPTNGQATLASVIARAQLQNLPPMGGLLQDAVAEETSDMDVVAHTTSPDGGVVSGDTAGSPSEDQSGTASLPSLSMYGLSDEQTKMLELAIASAASAAQAQAEAEAALEEDEEDYGQDDDDYDEIDIDPPNATE
ncbi:hypothetical protein BDQ12DRAFT_661084 [Crucibulum laeve]|uniref:C2H2-type domain-containing protein n=1 Tax=Crucibulum laeve TaxID=68775 RepID=A0A5C3MI12_9AGAR|nr:hypothetical protein BDQ12DRAFT_661084 [Crucibulum laeve]